MSGPFGVTDAGFIPKTQQDLLDQIETQQRATIDPALDVSPDQPLGQINGIFSRALAEIEELIHVAYDAFDPDRAEGDRLTSISKLTGTERNGATFSTVNIEVDLATGTELVAGTHFVQVTGNPEIQFTPIQGIVRDAPGGPVSLPFRAENPGPVAALAHTLTTIATPVSGWTAADNPLDATLGQEADTDPILRARRQKALQATGSATVGAIRSDILELKDEGTGEQFVQSCIVLENTGDVTDVNGLPPHSFEALIYDGTPTSPHSDQIAQVIWDDRADGIRSVGASSGTATDELGVTHIVPFSRAMSVPIYVSFTLSTGPGYIGAAAVKTLVAQLGNAQYKTPGADIIALFVEALPLFAGGVLDVTAFAIGRSPSPTLDNNVPIGIRELARFDTTNITIV